MIVTGLHWNPTKLEQSKTKESFFFISAKKKKRNNKMKMTFLQNFRELK
jgi:hypothetical protein